jgi:hypothetical protein
VALIDGPSRLHGLLSFQLKLLSSAQVFGGSDTSCFQVAGWYGGAIVSYPVKWMAGKGAKFVLFATASTQMEKEIYEQSEFETTP